MNKVKHLYIHIPFCNHICSYCDFKRCVCNQQVKKTYIDNLLKQLNKCSKYKFKTIYLGGGTPNCLGKLIIPLLKCLSKLINKDSEFTIECNPELITLDQLKLFKKYKVNRISLGVQTTNDKLLKQIGRKHTIKDVYNVIKLLKQTKFNNFSIDLIYGFNNQTIKDISNDFNFIKKYKIPHISFYCLEIKDGSILKKQNYKLDEEKIDAMLKYIIDQFNKLKYSRYEVSNWCLNKKYESQHNLAYWNTNDWKGIGYGAFGLENKNYYENIGSISSYMKKSNKLSQKDYYQQIWMMGLRTKYGLDLTNPIHKRAFNYFKNNVDLNLLTINKTSVVAKDLNTIDNILLQII